MQVKHILSERFNGKTGSKRPKFYIKFGTNKRRRSAIAGLLPITLFRHLVNILHHFNVRGFLDIILFKLVPHFEHTFRWRFCLFVIFDNADHAREPVEQVVPELDRVGVRPFQ